MGKLGFLSVNSGNNPGNPNCIDCLDTKGDFVRGYMDRSEMLEGLFVRFKPDSGQYSRIMRLGCYTQIDILNLLFSVTPSDKLLIYFPASGKFRVFNSQGELMKSVRLWPKKVLQDYRNKAMKISKLPGAFAPYFFGLIPDHDNPNYFYLNYGNFQDGKKNYLYKFDLSGSLAGVLHLSNPKRSVVQVNCKRKHKFYAIDRNQYGNLTIKIYREENHE